jgi:dephospho-CoA kinase
MDLMLRVGLTGGIACGKSTVVAMLREMGCAVLEADPIAHKMIERGGPAYEDVLREFGSAICGPDGSVDRKRLGAIVFADDVKRALLNRIVHPHVIRWQEKQLTEWEQAGLSLGVIEAALLIEAGYHKQMDRLVVCWCRPEQQVERLLGRGLTQQQAAERIAAQMPIAEKRALADDPIDCSGTLEQTREETTRLVAKLKELAAKKRSLATD